MLLKTTTHNNNKIMSVSTTMGAMHALKYPISPVLGHELEFEVERGFDFHQSLLILFPSLLLLDSVYQGGLATREGSNVCS